MTEFDENTLICPAAGLCSQAGFLPVPLKCVPPESLADMEVYIVGGDSYSLYSADGFRFSDRDAQRLLGSGVEYVYIAVRDHQKYSRTIEECLVNIITDRRVISEKKAQILYATSTELANQILSTPPNALQIDRTANMSRATVQLILNDNDAFSQLFETFNHDFYTATHMVNVCGLAISLGQKMGLAEANVLQKIGTGAMLHDIGKQFIPPEILNAPGSLTHEQFDIVKNHVKLGYDHLLKVGNLSEEALAVVFEHHERMDGSGYPQGLKHDQISPLGRLAGIVDSFDAMISMRPYRDIRFSAADALQMIEDEAPEKFDLDIVRAFASVLENAGQVESDQKNKSTQDDLDDPNEIAASPETQYYFRFPVEVRKIARMNGKIRSATPERMIAYRLSCTEIGLLSDHPFAPNQNLLVSAKPFEKIGLKNLVSVVTNCQDRGGGWYTVDARLLQAQQPEQVAKIKQVTVVREVSPILVQ